MCFPTSVAITLTYQRKIFLIFKHRYVGSKRVRVSFFASHEALLSYVDLWIQKCVGMCDLRVRGYEREWMTLHSGPSVWQGSARVRRTRNLMWLFFGKHIMSQPLYTLSQAMTQQSNNDALLEVILGGIQRSDVEGQRISCVLGIDLLQKSYTVKKSQ